MSVDLSVVTFGSTTVCLFTVVLQEFYQLKIIWGFMIFKTVKTFFCSICWQQVMGQIGKMTHFWEINILAKTRIPYLHSKSLNMRQCAEYDKRVANISLLIYIGLLGLHPSSCQSPSRLHTLTHIHICIDFGSKCLISHLLVIIWINPL